MAQNELGNLHYTLGIDDKDFNNKMKLAKETLKSFDGESQKLLSLKIRVDSNLNTEAIKALAELTRQTNAKAKADANAALAAQRMSQAELNKAKSVESAASAGAKSALEMERMARAQLLVAKSASASADANSKAALELERMSKAELNAAKSAVAKAKSGSESALAAERLSKAELNAAKAVQSRADADNKAASARLNLAKAEAALSGQEARNLLIRQKTATEAERTAVAHQRLENASRKVADSQKKLSDWSAFTNKTFTNQKVIAYQLANALGTTFSVYAVGAFVNKLAEVRGEFELQQVAIRAIIRDKQAADKIFSQVKTLAVESPFQFKDLIRDTKQLAAFSIETDKLFDTTKRLADISAGLGVDMGRIVLAYGQVKAATVLRGQELRQFTEAGIPLVDKLAEKFSKLEGKTVSAGDVFERISNRMVSFKDVDQIFTDMTSSGGMFFEMQKKQADTLYGKISNLKDSYALMLNDIGEANDGLLKGGVNAISGLIKNWDKVASILKVVIATYGTYKAISISAAAIDRVRNAIIKEYIVLARASAAEGVIMSRSMLLSSAKANVLTGSMNKLKMAMLSNPITAVSVAMVALGTAVYEVGSRYEWFSNSAEKGASSAKRLNESVNQMSSSKIDMLMNTYDYLSGKINKSSDENERFKNTIISIGKEVPDVVTKLDEYGNAAEINVAKANKAADAERKARNERTKQDLADSQKKYDQLDSDLKKERESLRQNEKMIKTNKSAISDFFGADVRNTTLDRIDEIKKSMKELSVVINNAKISLGIIDKPAGSVKELGYSIKWLSSEILKLTKYGKDADIASKFVEGSQDIKTAREGIISTYNEVTAAVEMMTSAKKGMFPENEIAAAKKRAELYKVIKENLLGVYDKKAIKEAKEEEDAYSESLKNRIDLIKQAKQQYEELSKAYGKTTAAAIVKSRFPEIPNLQLDGDKYKSQFSKAISDLQGHTSKKAIELRKSLNKDIKDIEQKGMIQPFDKALENFQRFIDENQDKFNLYQRILEATGSESKAIELSFGFKMDSVDIESVMKKQVVDAANKLQSEGGFKFDFEINYENLVKNIDQLPDRIRPSVQKMEDYIREKTSNALVGRLTMLTEQLPEGMGLQFDFSRVLSQLDKDINSIQNKAKLLTFGATSEEIDTITKVTNKATAAQKEIYRQKVAEMGRAYIEENLMNKQLWASYSNLGDASITELSAMQKEFANMQKSLLSGAGLQGLTGTEAMSPVGSILGQLGDLSSVDALKTAVDNMLASIQLGQQNIITLGSSTTLINPEETDRLNVVLTLIKSIAENISSAQRRVNDTSLDKKLASFKKLHSNITGTIKSVYDLGEAMGVDLPSGVKDVLDVMSATADGIMGVMDAVRAYQQATQAATALSTSLTLTGIAATSTAANTAVISTSFAAAASIKMVESASVILAIISAALAVATAIANIITGNQKKKADNAIEKQKKLIDSLKAAYEEVEKAAEKFYTLDVNTEASSRWIAREKAKLDFWYKNLSAMSRAIADKNGVYNKKLAEINAKGVAMIGKSVLDVEVENMKAQQVALEAQVKAAKKDNKKGKRNSEINGYLKEIDELNAKIAEVQDKWYDTLRGTSLQSAADDFAEAWVDAFLMGEDAMESFSGKFDEVMKNMIVKQAAMRVMSKVLQPLFNQIDAAIGTSGELNVDEVKSIVAALPGIMANLDAGMKAIIQPLLEAAGLTAGSGKTVGGLQGEIAGIKEDTAQLLASLLNAVRADVSVQTNHLLDIKEIMSRTQNSVALGLTYLARIDANTYDLLQAFKSVVGGRGSQGDGRGS